MENYKTVEEKAVEWNISSRHIQYLCRNKKIAGAIKRAGSWFIPGDAPSPAKNSRAGAGKFEFVGTKKEIFNSAVKLFMRDGFDKVSMSDIADEIGIRQSTIYNHFESKQEILDTIYDFYCHNYLKNRPARADIEAALNEESLINIIGRLRYDFEPEHLQRMSEITKIIFQRIGIDGHAREIAKSMMVDEGVKYVEDVFNRAVEIGRFAPFDTHIMAIFINSIRIFTLFHWILDSSDESMAKLFKDEQTLYQNSVKLIRELKPVAAAGNDTEQETAVKTER